MKDQINSSIQIKKTMDEYLKNHLFNLVWEKEEILIIKYCSEWETKTGYLGGAIDYYLAAGNLVKGTDLYGRKFIFIGTRFGTVIVFQKELNKGQIVINYKEDCLLLRLLILQNDFTSLNQLEEILGYYIKDNKVYKKETNIGLNIASIFKNF